MLTDGMQRLLLHPTSAPEPQANVDMATFINTMLDRFPLAFSHSYSPAQPFLPVCTTTSTTGETNPSLTRTASNTSLAQSLLEETNSSGNRLQGTHFRNARTRGSFKPRSANKGTSSYQLRQFAEATLGSGSLRKAVKLPEGEDLNEWYAVNGEQH